MIRLRLLLACVPFLPAVIHAEESKPLPAETAEAAIPPVEVFRRAFWRNPGDDDKILHALRREEKDEQGRLARWSWWIALQPGAGFHSWLLRENPFGLAEETDPERRVPTDGAPDWFPAKEKLAGFSCRRVPAGTLVVFIDPKTGTLYASDCGLGFAAPARPLKPERK